MKKKEYTFKIAKDRMNHCLRCGKKKYERDGDCKVYGTFYERHLYKKVIKV